DARVPRTHLRDRPGVPLLLRRRRTRARRLAAGRDRRHRPGARRRPGDRDLGVTAHPFQRLRTAGVPKSTWLARRVWHSIEMTAAWRSARPSPPDTGARD